VEVVAILNDTTGTLVAGAHDYPDCAIGLILGMSYPDFLSLNMPPILSNFVQNSVAEFNIINASFL
jgi:hypothetical protein